MKHWYLLLMVLVGCAAAGRPPAETPGSPEGIVSVGTTQPRSGAAPAVNMAPAGEAAPTTDDSAGKNFVEIASVSVSVDRRVIYRLDQEQFRLAPNWRQQNRPLADALESSLDGAADVVVASQPDANFLILARVVDALLSEGRDTITMTLGTTPTKVTLGEGWLRHDEDGLLLLIVTDGVSLKGPGGNVAPGCQGLGPGLAIGRAGGEIDYRALTDCVKRLVGDDVAANSNLRRVFLTANPGTPFRELLGVARALGAAGAHVVGLRVL